MANALHLPTFNPAADRAKEHHASMTSNPYTAYQEVGTTTADPITLTTMLFDGGLKALKKCRMHYEAGNREKFVDENIRAQLIVGELLCTLDMEKGGELAQTLSGLYAYCLRCLVEASLGDLTKIDEVELHLGRITEAWKAATAQLRAERAGAPREAVA